MAEANTDVKGMPAMERMATSVSGRSSHSGGNMRCATRRACQRWQTRGLWRPRSDAVAPVTQTKPSPHASIFGQQCCVAASSPSTLILSALSIRHAACTLESHTSAHHDTQDRTHLHALSTLPVSVDLRSKEDEEGAARGGCACRSGKTRACDTANCCAVRSRQQGNVLLST